MLDRVTFTGADDSTDIDEMVEISRRFPFVEWGILFSKTHQGSPRFPSIDWLHLLKIAMSGHPEIQLSAHLCGRLVRELVLDAQWTFAEYVSGAYLFQRVQVNFHGQFHRAHPNFGKLVQVMAGAHLDGGRLTDARQFIFQCDGVNDGAVREFVNDGLGVPLFDTSGGAGVLPDRWPTAWPGVYCGYAGGLGPANIAQQLEAVAAATSSGGARRWWIDMERNVRSADDAVFDLAKVRAVLEIVQASMKESPQ